jgi:hypothetical protein
MEYTDVPWVPDLLKEATSAGKWKFAPCGIRNNTISAQQGSDGSLLRRNRDTSVLRFQYDTPFSAI